MNTYFVLFGAITFEVAATSFLKQSNGFTNLSASILTVFCYAISFYLLSLVLKELPTGLAYAMWAGLGIVLISVISWLVFGQRIDFIGIIGLLLIVTGVIIINLFSKAALH